MAAELRTLAEGRAPPACCDVTTDTSELRCPSPEELSAAREAAAVAEANAKTAVAAAAEASEEMVLLKQRMSGMNSELTQLHVASVLEKVCINMTM